MNFNPTFDFPAESAALGGGDPDSDSPTMRAYHQRLWSKPLPTGDMFDLDASDPNRYLYHRSNRGEFILSSDRCIPSWTNWKRPAIASIVSQVPQRELDEFNARAENMGGTMIWPRTEVNGHRNINQERGQNWYIVDRLDLTVECIRRYYLGEENPMSECLARYADFFSLFEDFTGFIDFFLLEDLVSNGKKDVAFFFPFETFEASRLPRDADEYAIYRANAAAFIEARNQRMIADLATR